MIRQPKRGSRNVNDCFYDYEAEQISRLNEIFGSVQLNQAEEHTLLWLAGWDESTVCNVVSAIRKVMAAQTKTAEIITRE